MTANAFGFSDEARRAADQVNVHVAALGREACGKWVAIRLSDGGSDGTLYDTRPDAIRHQFHEQQCAYFCIPGVPTFLTAREAEAFLTYCRSLYDAGYRIPDPTAPAPIVPLTAVAAPGRGSRLALPYRGLWIGNGR